jgi:hypothetical protein
MSDSFSERDWFWTASGKTVGYRENDALFSPCGTQIGEFDDDDVYGASGYYLGEISSNGRLVTRIKKLNWSRAVFTPLNRTSFEPAADLVPQELTAGCRNFKVPNLSNKHKGPGD